MCIFIRKEELKRQEGKRLNRVNNIRWYKKHVRLECIKKCEDFLFLFFKISVKNKSLMETWIKIIFNPIKICVYKIKYILLYNYKKRRY